MSARNLILLDGAVVTAIGAHTVKAWRPDLRAPRFQLKVESLTAGAAPAGIVIIQHAEINEDDWTELCQFDFLAEGSVFKLTEELATRWPFSRMRANVTQLADITSATLTLVGLFDIERG